MVLKRVHLQVNVEVTLFTYRNCLFTIFKIHFTDSVKSRDRFCGKVLGYCTGEATCTENIGAVTTFTKPFIIGVMSDDSETNDSANRGFNLLYSQQPCITAG